ncbi:DNA alkylation repair protein [bacterium]|nr:DNA alkylation repair protein [bacterium]
MDRDFIDDLKAAMLEAGNPSDAEQMYAYMKEQCPFYGLKATPRREIFKTVLYKHEPIQNFEATAKGLFEEEYRELHMCGQELVFKNKKLWNENTIETLEWMIGKNSWWDSVDYIATTCVGHFFKKFPERKESITEKWNKSGKMWYERSSIIFQLKYKDKTDTDMLSRYILNKKDDKEFFIRKAIGWALREYSRTDPQFVLDFVKKHKLSPLSEREAIRNIK